MRARNLKPGFFKNPDLADAGPVAQLLFAGLWCLADREGRLKDLPRVIKAEVFPYYDVDVNRELTVLSRLGLVRRYVSDGIAVIEVLNFKKHQHPHHTERQSDLPPFTDASACIESTPEIHGELTVNSRKSNGEYPADSLNHESLNHESLNQVQRAARPRKRGGFDFDASTIAGLDPKAWADWLTYRESIRKPIKPPSLKAAAEAMAKLGAGQATAVQHSIANGWQGLFPPAGKPAPVVPLPKPAPTPEQIDEAKAEAARKNREQLARVLPGVRA